MSAKNSSNCCEALVRSKEVHSRLEKHIQVISKKHGNAVHALHKAENQLERTQAELESCKAFAEYYKNELEQALARIEERDKKTAKIEALLELANTKMDEVVTFVGQAHTSASQKQIEVEKEYEDIVSAPIEVQHQYSEAIGMLQVTSTILSIINATPESDEEDDNPSNISIA